MRAVGLFLISVPTAGLALSASAQQTGDSDSQADSKYCSTLAKLYQSMYPVQEGMSASDVTLMDGCTSNPSATIATLQKKLTDKKISLPPEPGVAHDGNAR
jgi:hypothetical protein